MWLRAWNRERPAERRTTSAKCAGANSRTAVVTNYCRSRRQVHSRRRWGAWRMRGARRRRPTSLIYGVWAIFGNGKSHFYREVLRECLQTSEHHVLHPYFARVLLKLLIHVALRESLNQSCDTCPGSFFVSKRGRIIVFSWCPVSSLDIIEGLSSYIRCYDSINIKFLRILSQVNSEPGEFCQVSVYNLTLLKFLCLLLYQNTCLQKIGLNGFYLI